MRNSIWCQLVMGAVLGPALCASLGCSKDTSSFSILPTGSTFHQNTASTNSKIDVLWVIDNSGSMETSQSNLTNNFPSFINGFSSRNLDFHMAVTGTDSFIALPSMSALYDSLPSSYYLKQKPASDWARFRDGYANHSGVYVMDRLTPSLNATFVTNALLGTDGLGDERPFQSMRAVLESPLNNDFLRPDSFLAVIMLTDEDDFSNDSINYLENQYTNPALHTIDSYVQALEAITHSTPTKHRFNVHAISVQDQACLNQLGGSWRKIATRVNALAEATGGVRVSLCGDFGQQLQLIADNIIQLSTQFYLTRTPVESTIEVRVNGQLVPNVSNNPGPLSGGWYYNATANSIVFQGDYIPPQGSEINVTFDPISLGG